MSDKGKRAAIVYPREQAYLDQLGENILLAMRRRKLTQSVLCSRTGISKPTLRKIVRGDSTVSIGHYLRVLAVLGLAQDLATVAQDDELGAKLQNIELLKVNVPRTSTQGRLDRDNVELLQKTGHATERLAKTRQLKAGSARKPSERVKRLLAAAKSKSNTEQ